jgi:Ca2+-binding EF-hand superfamily protein
MPDSGINEDKAKAVIFEMDKNGDGLIDKPEFVNYVEAK